MKQKQSRGGRERGGGEQRERGGSRDGERREGGAEREGEGGRQQLFFPPLGVCFVWSFFLCFSTKALNLSLGVGARQVRDPGAAASNSLILLFTLRFHLAVQADPEFTLQALNLPSSCLRLPGS